MTIKLYGDWEKVKKLFGDKKTAEDTMSKAKMRAMGRITAYFEGQVKKNIVSGGTLAGKPFQKLSPLTIKIKGSTKPLIDKGDMLGNIKAFIKNENVGFIGLKRGSRHTSGEKLVDIGEIHEKGAIIKNHEVPARPFLGPVLEKFKPDGIKKYTEGLQEVLDE